MIITAVNFIGKNEAIISVGKSSIIAYCHSFYGNIGEVSPVNPNIPARNQPKPNLDDHYDY